MAHDAPAFPSQKGIRLVRTTVGKDWLVWAIFVLIALTTAWTKSEIVWLFVLCGIIGALVKAPLQIPKRTSAIVFVGGFDRGWHSFELACAELEQDYARE